MDIIQLLPDSVANQIAAGEVIQRPASVIKELVENSIDAGAKAIKVLVVDAGKTSIQIIDDGCGMSPTDARLSFERHATSKIRKADDLFTLHTMGFRGEALASIAAVAQVTLQTRRAEDELGTKLCIAGTRVESQEPVVCPVGSNFLIENLFFNVPARRRFLKSAGTESSHINQVFQRIVLVYPEIEFTLYNNGQQTVHLPATTLRQRIVDVVGRGINKSLLPIDTNTTLCKIAGFVGKPESAKKKGAQQFFFVNGRYMKHPYFHKAVQTAFDRLVPNGEQVPYFIYFDVNPEEIDVNVHPVKTEIKFENEQAIFQIIMASVRDAVGKFAGTTEIDFDVVNRPDIPVYDPGMADVRQPGIVTDPSYNPFASSSEPRYNPAPKSTASRSPLPSSSLGIDGYRPKPSTTDWQQLYSVSDGGGFKPSAINTVEQQMEGSLFPSSINENDDHPILNRAHEHLQMMGRYIVTQVDGGLMFTDQHRADVRILFEKYMDILATRTPDTQKLLFSQDVQFPPSYSPLLSEVIGDMCRLGFVIKSNGNNSYSIEGVPAGLVGLDPVTLVNELVSATVEFGSSVSEEVNSFLAAQLAERAATPLGEVLSQQQMESIVERLLCCRNYRYTTDGKNIVYVMPTSELDAKF